MTGSAKQSIPPRKERMDCFVASLLATTLRAHFETKKPAVIRDGRLLSMRERNSATVTQRNAYRNDGIGKTARETP
jgi:hypothetical protein